MGKKSSKAPDVVGAAETEGRYSRETARDVTYADRPDQFGPLGNVRWSTEQVIDPATGEPTTRWTQNNNLAPQLQGIMDSSLSQAQGSMMNPPDWGQFGDVQGFDPNAQRQSAEDAAYQRATNRLDPRFNQAAQQMEVDLRSKGLRPGDQAYDATMANFMRGKNDAYEQARLASSAEGRQEFGVALQGNERANALRDQEIQEYLAKRGYGLSEAERVSDLVGGQA